MAKRNASNDDIPECELVLAMALQNAQARGFKSTRFYFFDKYDRNDIKRPTPDATKCCFRGALLLEPDSAAYDDKYCLASAGNNAADDQEPWYDGEEAELWRVGAAFEVALRD